MKLHKLLKVTGKTKKRLGRGLGSGKGKTATRGTKGQKAREKVAIGFIGGTLPLYKKIPYRRGLGNPKRSRKMVPLPLAKLGGFKSQSSIDLQALIEKGLVGEKEARFRGVKVVNGGEITVALKVNLPVTTAAALKIVKAGGTIIRG
ncbi:MAG: 50S ribosomal protein L15 [bacterium]|nr:50S ribosomal protein L15 [bacterium]